jgi:hypothetical protein
MPSIDLQIPDTRSTELVFQLLTQVAGRSGRGGAQKGRSSYKPYFLSTVCSGMLKTRILNHSMGKKRR